MIEQLSTELIPKNIEIYSFSDEESFTKMLNAKKSDLIIIDFCMVKKSLEYFLDNFFYKSKFYANLIFGISKSDINAFKQALFASENYKIAGIFLRSFTSQQIVNYLLSSLKKIKININERRKNIRVIIDDYNRCFAFIVEKGSGISCRIIDISLGGMKCQVDDINFLQYFSAGNELKLIHLYIKSYHIIASGKIIYVSKPYFAIEFTYLSEKDKDNLSVSIFNLLSENNQFLI